MKTRVTQRYRDYDDSLYTDEDFTHCAKCGVEILKTEASEIDGDYICPDCTTK
jgi:hypothetical protein